jgi:hypothetical protein
MSMLFVLWLICSRDTGLRPVKIGKRVESLEVEGWGRENGR